MSRKTRQARAIRRQARAIIMISALEAISRIVSGTIAMRQRREAEALDAERRAASERRKAIQAANKLVTDAQKLRIAAERHTAEMETRRIRNQLLQQQIIALQAQNKRSREFGIPSKECQSCRTHYAASHPTNICPECGGILEEVRL